VANGRNRVVREVEARDAGTESGSNAFSLKIVGRLDAPVPPMTASCAEEWPRSALPAEHRTVIVSEPVGDGGSAGSSIAHEGRPVRFFVMSHLDFITAE
jgi:hypothetical protein